MEVEFRRTGDRQYAVAIRFPGRSTLEMNPAPGYDARMPHDLLHFVVERELGIRHGIFGQLAAGGTAGTFHPTAGNAASVREAARQRRALAKRGEKLLHQGRADSAKSEYAADICRRAWLEHTARGRIEGTLGGPFPPAEIARVCDALDELGAAWAKLRVGEALTLEWTMSGGGERSVATPSHVESSPVMDPARGRRPNASRVTRRRGPRSRGEERAV